MAIRKKERGSGDLATLVVRGTLGALLAGHGAQKGLGWFNGPGMEGTSGFMEMLGLRPGRPWATLAVASELGGGTLTALGLLHPLGPVGIIGSMAMAWKTAHGGKPIWATEGGAELPLTNIAAALALMISGPGKYSLDRALGIRLPRWIGPLGLGAVLLTVLYAASVNEEASDEDTAREELAGEED
ncbi:MAG: DoxX family protein [Actinobacteria bacterium]|nr:DoxX family protein [Actinomycetota bacterium]